MSGNKQNRGNMDFTKFYSIKSIILIVNYIKLGFFHFFFNYLFIHPALKQVLTVSLAVSIYIVLIDIFFHRYEIWFINSEIFTEWLLCSSHFLDSKNTAMNNIDTFLVLMILMFLWLLSTFSFKNFWEWNYS